MYSEQLHNKIEAYLANRMNPEERAAFEREMEEDPVIRNYLQAHRNADNAIAWSLKKDLKNRLTAIDHELDQTMQKNKSKRRSGWLYKRWRSLSIAASIFIAFGLVLHFWTRNRTAPEKLAEKNLVSLDFQTRGDQTGESPFLVMEEAATAFKDKQYDKAAGLYQSVLDGDNLLHEAADINLALALLAQNKTEEAKRNLGTIARNEDHQYQQKATEILKKLEK